MLVFAADGATFAGTLNTARSLLGFSAGGVGKSAARSPGW